MHCVQGVLRLSELYQSVGIDGGKLVVVALQESDILGASVSALGCVNARRSVVSSPLICGTIACNMPSDHFQSCQGPASLACPCKFAVGKEHTAILVTCLLPLLLSRGLLALSTSGLPTNALWLATELHPRAAMVSMLNIPGDMVAVCGSLYYNSCPFAGFRRQPHLHLR